MDEPIVAISTGKVRGRILENAQGGEFLSFQGIPYGKAPIGKLRFRAPEAAEPWSDIFDATDEGPMSVQKHYLTKEIIGSEDCLNINVYTHKLPSEKEPLKAVMVFIHGGAFAQGSNKTEIYGPDFLLTEDIVLVTFNYRLGILGFLHLQDPKLNVPGNAAFKDMVLALKWIQTNIAQFNGDPNNVTLFGESAGAGSAHLLMLSPLSQGLFHKVIAQSGCVLNSWMYGKYIAEELIGYMGLQAQNEQEILDLLLKATPEEIFTGQLMLDETQVMANAPRYLGVVVEKPSSEPAFLTKSPIEILLSGAFKKVPIIMGYNNMEGLLFDILVKPEKQSMYWTDSEINLPSVLQLEKGSAVSKVVADKILKFYFGANTVDKAQQSKQLYDITTDNCFLRGIYSSVKIHASQSLDPPTYMYRMSIETDLNTYKRLTGTQYPGVCHADDLGYLFKNIFTPTITEGSAEDIGQKRFVRLWTNFARFGNPTPDRASDELLGQLEWKPVQKNRVFFLDIGRELKMDVNPEAKRMAFWDSIYRIRPLTAKL